MPIPCLSSTRLEVPAAVSCYHIRYAQSGSGCSYAVPTVRVPWYQELCKWLPELVEAGHVNLIFTGKDKIERDRPVTILSYDLFAKFEEQIREWGGGVVIADEGHYLKNAQAKRSKVASLGV
eukprot:2769862-Rhodomonas_salina.4